MCPVYSIHSFTSQSHWVTCRNFYVEYIVSNSICVSEAGGRIVRTNLNGNRLVELTRVNIPLFNYTELRLHFEIHESLSSIDVDELDKSNNRVLFWRQVGNLNVWPQTND